MISLACSRNFVTMMYFNKVQDEEQSHTNAPLLRQYTFNLHVLVSRSRPQTQSKPQIGLRDPGRNISPEPRNTMKHAPLPASQQHLHRTTRIHPLQPAQSPALKHAAPAKPAFPRPTMTTYDEYGIPVGAYSEPENLATQAWRLLRVLWVYRARPIVQGRYSAFRRGDWSFRRVCTLVNALVLVWWAVLYWGERGVFNGAVESCNWERWEDWVWQYVVCGLKRMAWLIRRVGRRRKPPSARLDCRPAAHRPAYVSRPAVAAEPAHVQVHGFVLAPDVFSLPDGVASGYYLLPWRLV